jgi:hypothetical protein
MPERKTYEPVLSSQAVAFLLGLPKGRQRKLFHLIYQLSENPAQVGDYSLPDDAGREVQFLLMGDLIIAFWPDDAVQELRIVEISEI